MVPSVGQPLSGVNEATTTMIRLNPRPGRTVSSMGGLAATSALGKLANSVRHSDMELDVLSNLFIEVFIISGTRRSGLDVQRTCGKRDDLLEPEPQRIDTLLLLLKTAPDLNQPMGRPDYINRKRNAACRLMSCLITIPFGAQLVNVADETPSVPLPFAVEDAASPCWPTGFIQLNPEGFQRVPPK